jgi:type VI secretion system protein ImpL
VATVNSDISIKPYLMSDFWGGVPDAHRVAAAYTAEGRERIAEFISEIEDALYDPLLLAEKKLDFYQWYDRQYIRSWHEFARLFPQGVRMLQGRQRWERIVSKAGSDQDPYFVFMEVLADNLEPYRAAQTPPAWVDLVYAFEAARLEAALKGKKNAAGKAGLVRKATRKVASALRRVDRSAGTDLDGALDTEKRLLAGEAFSDYRSALTELIVLLGSRKSAYETAALFYRNPEASGTEGNLFSRAYTHARALESLLSDPGGDLGVMKDLIRGSVDFLHQFALRETACHMQQQWEEQVLMEVRGLAAQEVNSLLMGENGKARHFVEGAAAPFIERSLTKGYYPAALEDQAVAFAPGFFTYLNRAETAAKTARSSYQVVVRAEPTGVNPGARMPPHETVTNLLCPGGGTELVNQNYPVSKSFRYSPQECRDLLLTIKIGNLELQKAYRGSLAFPRFIRDFASGSRRLMAAEFPEQEAALKRMGIDYIAMEYEFKRHKPVLDFFRAAVAPLPEVIAPCWD